MYTEHYDLLAGPVRLFDVVAHLIVSLGMVGLSLATAAGVSQLFSP
jgi:hypothetical protein